MDAIGEVSAQQQQQKNEAKQKKRKKQRETIYQLIYFPEMRTFTHTLT